MQNCRIPSRSLCLRQRKTTYVQQFPKISEKKIPQSLITLCFLIFVDTIFLIEHYKDNRYCDVKNKNFNLLNKFVHKTLFPRL